jgi:hypothetical protein
LNGDLVDLGVLGTYTPGVFVFVRKAATVDAINAPRQNNVTRYAASVPFRGDADRAFALAESALTALAFRHTERTAAALELVGPGMNSTRQSALVGASRIRIVSDRGELALEADLHGVASMARFVILFPIGLCLFLAILFAIVFSEVFWGVAAATGAAALLWLLLGPLMARTIRARTCRALDALLANMVIVGESSKSST